MQYQLQKNIRGDVVAVTIVGQNISIPFANDNTDYQVYLKWIALGNTPQSANT